MTSDKEQQFLKLINLHRGIIHKISRMYMVTRQDQEDLSQEIIIQLWKSYESFRSDSHFSTWMYRVALNTAITFVKRDKRSIFSSGLNSGTEMVSDMDYDASEGKIELFYKAVQSLSHIEKAIIFLYLEGQSHKEIAEKMGISEGNARVKLTRTKDKLQTIIKEQPHESR